MVRLPVDLFSLRTTRLRAFPKMNIYVGNLAYGVTDDDLREALPRLVRFACERDHGP